MRTLPIGYAAELAKAMIAPVYMVEINWPTGPLYVWSGYGNLSWNSKIWQGLGHLGTISAIEESADQTANGMTYALKGPFSSVLSSANRNDVRGKVVALYFGLFNSSGFISPPYLAHYGFIDYVTISDTGEEATITLTVESEQIDNRSGARRYTHEDQQLDYPGDLGFEYVTKEASKEIKWGP